MTSQTFLNKPHSRKNTGLFSFTSSFSIRLIFVNIAVLAFLIFYCMVYTQNDSLVRMYSSNTVYVLMNKYNVMMLFILLIAQAMVTAVLTFNFMFDKRAAAAYLSLPINRGKLFITKYAAGLILIFIPILIFMTMMLAANVQAFGYSTVLMQGYLLFSGSALVVLFTAYSITAAVCLFAGTLAEGLIFTAVIIFGPLLLANGTTWILQFFLRGNTFGEQYQNLATGAQGLSYYIIPYMPSFVSAAIFEAYSTNFGEPFIVPFFGEHFTGSVMLVIWFMLSALICILAYNAFKRYKSENSGMLGTNKVLNLVSAFVVVYFTFAFFLPSVGATNSFLLIFSLLISMAVFALCRFLFTLSVKETFSFEGLKQMGGVMGVTCLVCLLSYTGLFGYSSRLPAFDKIEAAVITYAGAPDFILGESKEFGNYRLPYKNSIGQDNYTRDFFDLIYRSENDIRTVMELHKELASAKPRLFGNVKQSVDDPEKDTITYQVHIKYLLKDNTLFERQYKYVTQKAVTMLLKLDETDAVTERIAASLKEMSEAESLLPIMITDSLFDNEFTLNPTGAPSLFEALSKDIEELTPNAKYYPEKRARVVISFPRLKPDGSFEPVSLGSNSRSQATSSVSDNMNIYSVSTSVMRLYITDEYIHTLAFINENGIPINEPININTVKEMYVKRYNMNSLIYPTQAMYFRSFVSGFFDRTNSLVIDKNEYGHVLDLSKSHYFIAEGGYLVNVLVSVNDGIEKRVTLFMPESAAPDYIKKAL